MKVAFFPVSLDSISPTVGFEAALAALCNDGSRDHEMWAGVVNGETVIRWQYRGEMLTGEQYESVGHEHFVRYELASAILLEAVRSGDLPSFVWSSKQRSAFHVPRFYWNDKDVAALHNVFAGMAGAAGGDDSMTGQAVWLSEAKVQKWAHAASPRLEESVAARLADQTVKPKPQTKPLPKWFPMLETLIREADQKQIDWPRLHPNDLPPTFPNAPDFRKKLILKGWSADALRPSTVRYHVANIKQKLGR